MGRTGNVLVTERSILAQEKELSQGTKVGSRGKGATVPGRVCKARLQTADLGGFRHRMFVERHRLQITQ